MKVEGRGAGDMFHLRQRGERAGRRLMESGLYQQLDFMKRRVSGSNGAPVDRGNGIHPARTRTGIDYDSEKAMRKSR